MYYAQITDGVVTAVSELSGEVENPILIQIDGLDESLLDKAYENGQFTDSAPIAPPVPQVVTRRQAKQALYLRSKLALVQPAIDAIQEPTQRALMQIEWDDSQEFVRTRASLIAIGTAIGLDSSGLDELFTLAATL